MSLRALLTLLVLVATASGAGAQRGAWERVELRVTVAGPGSRVVVDRGARDSVERGDLVMLLPRGGGRYLGTVVDVEERSAVVVLRDRGFLPSVGTRGVVAVPRARLGLGPEGADEPAGERDGAAASKGADELPPRPPRSERDDGWTPDQPLLARVRAVRPEDRRTSVSGRVWASADGTYASSDRSDSFSRLGTDVVFDNPFRHGGALHLDGELNYRTTRTPLDAGDDDEATGRGRLDRFSYRHGGNRFSPNRWEVGRFLHSDMPEFGVLDGFEWSRRRENGDRFGASVGYLPEPDQTMETGDDFEVAAWYHWIWGDLEQLLVGAGFQKSWHHGEPDRDLLVAKVRWLPPEGIDFHTTAWVDFYSGSDDEEDVAVEVTQAITSVGKQWESGNGLYASYTHLGYPELLRREFTPILDAELADNRRDRLALDGWRWLGERVRVHGGAGAWNDDQETGGDGELGWEVLDLFGTGSSTDVTLFGAKGEFSNVAGARFSVGRWLENGRWDAFYEIADMHQLGFSDDRDDILQHRLRGSRDFELGRGWRISLYGEGRLWDDEDSWSLGGYLQKTF